MRPATAGNGQDINVLDDGEDVSGVSDRTLVLRAVNSMLAVDHSLGSLTRDISVVRTDIGEIRREMIGLRTAVLAAISAATVSATGRDRLPSAHEIAEEVASEITGPEMNRAPTDSDGVRALAGRIDRMQAADRWIGITGTARAVILAIVCMALGGVATAMSLHSCGLSTNVQ